MTISDTEFALWQQPAPADIAETVTGFLDQLQQPTCIIQAGRDNRRTRAVCTLLHGNEPSGLHGIHAWLRSGATPAVRTVIYLPSITAAQLEPPLTHRWLPEGRDPNRCFKAPFEGVEGERAQAIIALLEDHQPEALVDIHNTSGSGPAFGVSSQEDPRHNTLVSFFAPRMIRTDLRLGSLMELTSHQCPVVTIECGGAIDPEAHRLATEGIARYLRAEDVWQPEQADIPMDILHNPVRIELHPEVKLAYAETPSPDNDLTLPPDVVRHNFGVFPQGATLGTLGSRMGLNAIRVVNNGQQLPVQNWFSADPAHRLVAARDLRLFMITPNAEIARGDCLCYAVPA